MQSSLLYGRSQTLKVLRRPIISVLLQKRSLSQKSVKKGIGMSANQHQEKSRVDNPHPLQGIQEIITTNMKLLGLIFQIPKVVSIHLYSSLFLLVGILCVLLSFHLKTSAQMGHPDSRIWDLGRFEQEGQITLFDGPQFISSTGKPVELGDFNGNGCGDVAITGQNARAGAGQTRIVLDICELFGHAYDLFDQRGDNNPQVLNIYGAQPGDMLGTELYHADFNADGYDDLVIGAQNAVGLDITHPGAGQVYILFGKADLSDQPTLNIAPSLDDVMIIYGPELGARAGIWVEGGDFDGDGFQDLLIGANQADGLLNQTRRPNTGEAYIVYGGPNMLEMYGQQVDLSQASANITRFIGTNPDRLFGSTVYGADLNRDSVDDILMSAALWRGSAGIGGLAQGGGNGPLNNRWKAGETWIIFGNTSYRGQIIDLAELVDENGVPVDERVTIVYGGRPNDYMGEEIVVGDLNADDWNDLVVGSLATPGPNRTRIDGGEAWVIYVDETFPGQMIDLAEERPDTVVIYAAEADSKGGDTMLITDMNSDGIGDLLYGAPNADVYLENEHRSDTGILYVLYSTTEGLPNDNGVIDLFNPPIGLQIDLMIGADPSDMSAYAMSMLDIDRDGLMDIALNGMNGDGFNNSIPDAGEIYVISGADWREYRGLTEDPAETVTPTMVDATPVPLPSFTPIQDDEGPTLSIEAGQQLYELNCAGCHGLAGEGYPGLGYPLVESLFFTTNRYTDEEILAFVRVGRTADSPDSLIGRVMPPSGGNPALSDQQILAIIRYIRGLK